jgi:peroxidase
MFPYRHPKPSKNQRWSVGKGPNISLHMPKKVAQCDFNSKYRTANGSCNNKEHPNEFGVAMRPFRRLVTAEVIIFSTLKNIFIFRVLNPDYADGVSAARRAHDGSELPSARQVSLEVHRPSYHSDYNFTVMLAVWGQFLDHDITATALNQGKRINFYIRK